MHDFWVKLYYRWWIVRALANVCVLVIIADVFVILSTAPKNVKCQGVPVKNVLFLDLRLG